MLKLIPAFTALSLITLTSGCDLTMEGETDEFFDDDAFFEDDELVEFADVNTRSVDRKLQSRGSLTMDGKISVKRGTYQDGDRWSVTKFDSNDRSCSSGFFRECATFNIAIDEDGYGTLFFKPQVKFYPADRNEFGKDGFVVCKRNWFAVGRQVNAGCTLIVKTDEPYFPDNPNLGFRSKAVKLKTQFKGKVVGSGSSAELTGRLVPW